jgi:spore germination cell wall hydrolase CwlJ-like protein
MTARRTITLSLALLSSTLIPLIAPAGPARATPLWGEATSVLEPEEFDCLARTLYFEAGNQGRPGMEAVAAVVLNRVRDPAFPATICGVVRQGGERPPCQFEWWCDGRSDAPSEPQPWRLAQQVAKEALTDPVDDPTGQALYFHANYITSSFHTGLERTIQIGAHIFYR